MMAQGRPLRVGLDATPMLVAQRTGIERYATALIGELVGLYPTLDDVWLSVYLHAGNPYASQAHLDQALHVLRAAGLPHRVYGQRRGYGAVLSGYGVLDRLDLLHMLRLSRPWMRAIPYLLTIHDIKLVGLSEEGRQIEQAELSASAIHMIREAAGIITVSESTARDLAVTFGDRLNIPISAIHHGVDAGYCAGQDRARAMRAKYELEHYVFFVGTLQYRKNLPRLIDAFARVKRAHAIPHKLVLAGRDGWGAELVYAAVKEHGMESEVLFPGYLPESDLPGLYAGADVFAYPSLHEGFGIPVLEAMASRTVVVTSPLFAMPEVAGDAAVYVDPYDVDDIAAGLWRAIDDQDLRRALIDKGQDRVRLFTWRHMAECTVSFYRELRQRSSS